MTDMMVDIETTSTDPELGAIIQLSAVKFNYSTGEIGGVFDRCPMWLPKRGWSESTREFWLGKNKKVYFEIVARSEPYEPVFRDFSAFAGEGAPQDGYRFWSKPLSFDWAFVASHYEQLGLPMPFHYRYARDLNSFIAGLHGDPKHIKMEQLVPFNGDLHNGLHDCAFQIDCLTYAKNHRIEDAVFEEIE